MGLRLQATRFSDPRYVDRTCEYRTLPPVESVGDYHQSDICLLRAREGELDAGKGPV